MFDIITLRDSEDTRAFCSLTPVPPRADVGVSIGFSEMGVVFLSALREEFSGMASPVSFSIYKYFVYFFGILW